MIIEREYIKKIPLSHRKKYAQFFTPEQISDFMASWVLKGRRGEVEILEPAFGLGIFSRSMYKINPLIRVTGYDIDKDICKYANDFFTKPKYNVKIVNENYITSSWSDKYDVIICNPPYFKFHDYDNSTLIPIVNSKLNAHLNGFTNIYTLFLLKSIFQMKKGGRMAYIIPSEFLNSDYGVEVKRKLLQSGVLRHIIVVDFTRCAFDDVLTTACILLCENTENSEKIHFSNIDDVSKLCSSLKECITFNSSQLAPEVKWKQYYESTLSSKYNDLVPFSTFAKVSRGIATGANNYFTFKLSKIYSYNLPAKSFRRCICHSADVQTLIFSETDFESLSSQDKAVFLFNGESNESDPHVRNYLSLGENIGADKKYLTACRSPWYSIENRPPSPIWVSVFNRNGLRFVRNKAGVYNLTTFHCVYNIGEIDTDILFAYLVTNLAKEIFMDNARQYGNGLIKFEPNDLNKGNIVDLRTLTEEEREFVLRAYDKLHYNREISNQTINILDDFFKTKFTGKSVDIPSCFNRLEKLIVKNSLEKEIRKKTLRVRQLNFLDVFEQYADTPIVNNCVVNESEPTYNYNFILRKDLSKNCLISLVKKDNFEQYIEQSANIYYTGRRFPSTIALNKLYYFMPYLKGKGVRDLYFIKVARIGTRREGQSGEDKDDLRLVFEIEFVGQMFDDYQFVELNIWHSFRDTTMKDIVKLKTIGDGPLLHKSAR